MCNCLLPSVHIYEHVQTICLVLGIVIYINPLSVGLQNGKFCRGGAFSAPHLKSSRMKLQIYVRSQYRGSWVCQTHLHHFQMAIICLSCVYTCLHLWLRNKSKISIRHSKHVRTRGYMWNTRGRHMSII